MSVRSLPARIRHPQTTVRWRLTLLYGGLFLVCGAGLLAITYTLVDHATVAPAQEGSIAFVGRGTSLGAGVRTRVAHAAPPVNNTNLPHQLKVLPPQAQRFLRSPAGGNVIRFVGSGQRISDLHQLVIWSAIALAIMAVISALLGWLVAGRVLAPLRTITVATQEISEDNLHERLALRGPRDELRTLADTIDGLLERLEGAFDAQRRFVANASHELRTPLTATRALLELAVSDPHATVSSFREACRQALDESEQQERLIGALLALAHGERGIDHPQPIELHAVAQDVLTAQQAIASERGIRVAATLAPVAILGDRRLIERLVSNLVQNAIRHNARSGEVDVLVSANADQATLTIANTGPHRARRRH